MTHPILPRDDIEFARGTPVLGPNTGPRALWKGFTESFREDIAPSPMKSRTITDKVREKVWEDFNNYLLMDTEQRRRGNSQHGQRHR